MSEICSLGHLIAPTIKQTMTLIARLNAGFEIRFAPEAF
jgi:hypothetical protein